jgi:hypothetical protein
MPDPPDWLASLASQAKPTDFCWQLCEKLIALDKPISVGIDQVGSDLFLHAQSEFGLLPKPNMGSAVRRDISHFSEFLMLICGRVRQQQKEAA